MIDYRPLLRELECLGADAWANDLAARLEVAFNEKTHGDLKHWREAVDGLLETVPSNIDLLSAVRIGVADDLAIQARQDLREQLMKLHPWRKGPYEVFGIDIDTEWRSDWKWDRLAGHVEPLHKRLVLDVGCGNGYHCWRMLGEGARLVIGIDPTVLSVMQFAAIRKLHGEAAVYVLPVGIDDLPSGLCLFDTVFSMGVLYHRRSPIDHLLELKDCLRPGGQLVLETLVIDGDSDKVLVPEHRYAQMRNVWFLPSCDALMNWMRRCGYRNVKLCDVSKTTLDEQRSTDWMRFNSLKDFLDPDDPSLTCEGLPAPLRAIVTANVE